MGATRHPRGPGLHASTRRRSTTSSPPGTARTRRRRSTSCRASTCPTSRTSSRAGRSTRRRSTTPSPRSSRDASAAVHGDLDPRPRRPAARRGTWHTDVSPWLVGWVVGVEWDPAGTAAPTRSRPRAAPYAPGRYFAATATPPPPSAGSPATSTRWRRPSTRAASACRSRSPTGRPPTRSTHPEEPLPEEDLVGVDAEHVLPTGAWPGGTFASFHAYPYYPDFQRHERGAAGRDDGEPVDPYAGYLRALRRPLHLDAADGHRVRRAVLARLGARSAPSAATRAATPSRRRCGSTPSCCG